MVVVALVLALSCAGCDWAQEFAGPGHTSANPSEATFTVSSGAHFTTAWSASCVCLPPLEAGGLVYVADGYGSNPPLTVTLRALDATSGAQRWSVVINQINAAQFLAIGNGLAYVVLSRPSQPDEILGFDAAGGGLRWGVTPPGAGNDFAILTENVVLDGPTLFIGVDSRAGSTVSAIDTGGHVAWSANPPGALGGLVADPGRTIYAASNVTLTNPPDTFVHFLTGYREADGTRQSSIRVPNHLSDLHVANGLMYAGPVAMHPDTGQVVWSASGEGIVAVTDTVALTLGAGDLIARDAITGALRWRAPGAGPSAAGTQRLAIGGALVFVAHPYVIDVRSIEDGSLLGTTPPVSLDVDLTPANGHLYVDGAGTLWAFAPTST